jgi:hypothetical protein
MMNRARAASKHSAMCGSDPRAVRTKNVRLRGACDKTFFREATRSGSELLGQGRGRLTALNRALRPNPGTLAGPDLPSTVGFNIGIGKRELQIEGITLFVATFQVIDSSD